MNDLYDEIIRRQFLGLETYADNFKLGLLGNHVCVIGFTEEIYTKFNANPTGFCLTEFKLDAKTGVSFHLSSINKDIKEHIYNSKLIRYFIFNLTIYNLDNFTNFFCCDKDSGDYAGIRCINKLYLPDTTKLGSWCFCNLNISALYAPKVVEIDKRAFIGCNNLQRCFLDSYSDINIYALKYLDGLVELKLANNYKIKDTEITHWNGKYTIFTHIDCSQFKELTIKCLSSCILHGSKIQTYNFESLEKIYCGNQKGTILYKKNLLFPKLTELRDGYITSSSFNVLRFNSLRTLKYFSFKNCQFDSIIFDSLEELGIEVFEGGSCNRFEAPNLKALNLKSLKNFRIKELLINKNCVLEESHYLGLVVEKVIYVGEQDE